MVDAKRPIKGTHDAGVGKARELNNDLREQGRKEAGARDLKSTLQEMQGKISPNGFKNGKSEIKNWVPQHAAEVGKKAPPRSDAKPKTARQTEVQKTAIIHKPLSPKAQASGFAIRQAQKPNLQQLLQTKNVPTSTVPTASAVATPTLPQPKTQTSQPLQHAETVKSKTAVPENSTQVNGTQTKTTETPKFVAVQPAVEKGKTEEPKRNDSKKDSDKTSDTKKGTGVLAHAQPSDTKDQGGLGAALGGSSGETAWNPGFEVYGAVKAVEKKNISVLERARVFARDVEKRVALKDQKTDPQARTEMTKTEEGRVNARANVYGKIGA